MSYPQQPYPYGQPNPQQPYGQPPQQTYPPQQPYGQPNYPPQQYPNQYPANYPPQQSYPPNPLSQPYQNSSLNPVPSNLAQYNSQQYTGNSWYSQYSSPNDMLRSWFDSVDQDRSGSVDANELRRALAAGGENMSNETIDLMFGMFDRDKSGSVSFDEFSILFGYINSTRDAFNSVASNNSIGPIDLKVALSKVGFNVAEDKVGALFKKTDKKNFGRLEFGDFLGLCLYLGRLRTVFQRMDNGNTGYITVNFESLMSIFASV